MYNVDRNWKKKVIKIILKIENNAHFGAMLYFENVLLFKIKLGKRKLFWIIGALTTIIVMDLKLYPMWDFNYLSNDKSHKYWVTILSFFFILGLFFIFIGMSFFKTNVYVLQVFKTVFFLKKKKVLIS